MNAKIRLCLKCDREFKSIGSGNRICKRCRDYRDKHGSYYLEPLFNQFSGRKPSTVIKDGY